jgi:hypothetical protein
MKRNEVLKDLRRMHTLVLRNAKIENEHYGNDITIYTEEEIEIIKLIFKLEAFIEGV